MDNILAAIRLERVAQDTKWGVQQHSAEYWACILTEEVGEVSKAVIEQQDIEQIKLELVQTAAVCVAMIQALDDERALFGG